MEGWIGLLQICGQFIASLISFRTLFSIFFLALNTIFFPSLHHLFLCTDSLWIRSCAQKVTCPLRKYISSFWYQSLRLNSGNKTPISLFDDSSESIMRTTKISTIEVCLISSDTTHRIHEWSFLYLLVHRTL